MKRRHLIFDCDGTLVDSEGPIIKGLHELLLEEKGLELPYEELVKCMGYPGLATIRHYGLENEKEAMAKWNEKIAFYSKDSGFFKGVEELLGILLAKGVTMGVITSRNRFEYQYTADLLHFADYFTCSVTCDETRRHKPDSEPMLYYLHKAKAKLNDVIYIGDTMADCNCARNAGVPFILAGWGSHDDLGLENVAKSPLDILEIIGLN